jgi:protein gp37
VEGGEQVSADTSIEWADHTFNPWWGCEKVSSGCANCYAEGVAERFHGRPIWGAPHKTERKIAGEGVWSQPERWNRTAHKRFGRNARVFSLSMGDVCEAHPMLVEPRKRLVEMIRRTPNLDWLLLTKRPENADLLGFGNDWPTNVWFIVSVENQATADARIPILLRTGARVRGLSCEPLLGEVDISPPPMRGSRNWLGPASQSRGMHDGIDWVIVGGESGPSARPCNIEHVRSIVRQCDESGVPCFVKQLGAFPRCGHWSRDPVQAVVDRVVGNARSQCLKCGFSFPLHDRKGGDMSEWPADLRVRQFPGEAVAK